MKRLRYLYDGWEFIETRLDPKGDWLPATVPGHIHTDLIRHGIIGDPFVRMQEIGAQWVDETDWSYRTSFDWQPDPANPIRVLRFEGLDCIASVYLNGDLIGSHDNAFVPLEIDVSDRLTPGPNTLRVDFGSAARAGRARMAAYLEDVGLPFPTAGFAERCFIRKPQYMFGWDWGPRLVSVGFTRPVELIEYRARLADLWVQQDHRADGSVKVTVTATVDGPATSGIVHFGPGLMEEPALIQDATLSNGRLEATFNVAEPRLWWPNGLGGQDRYVVAVEISDEDGLADTDLTLIGLRKIELIRERDRYGESFRFVVNGQPVYALGANWIPDHSLPSAVTQAALDERLGAAAESGVNMLRVWGGGQYEWPEFYERCDALGIMVWQDFCYACGLYPDDAAAQAVAEVETRAAVKRLRNHPSLAIWCGNNENQMIHEGWYSREADRLHGDHIYHGVIPKVLAELDPARPYTPSSPWGKDESLATETERYQTNMGHIGNQHCWDVWHGRGDWRYYADSTARFVSEFGFCSSPSLEAWETCLGPNDDDPYGPVVRWHDKSGKGYDKYLAMVELHYPKAEDLEDLFYYTQLNQRDGMRFALEHFRTSGYCAGNLIWQLNDCWPVQSWALWDNQGNPKAAALELKRIFDPLLLRWKRKDAKLTLEGVLHNSPEGEESYGGAVCVADLVTGEVRHVQHVETVELAQGVTTTLAEIDVTGLPTSSTLVFTSQYEGFGAWTLLVEPKDVRAVAHPILASTYSSGELLLRLSGPVVDLWLHDLEGGARFHENFLTTGNGGVLSVPYDGKLGTLYARSLAGVHPVRVVPGPIMIP